MIASSPAVATSEPSGWKAMAYSGREWPSCRSSSVQRSTSQSLHEVSKEVVPTSRPDGWNATRERRPTWPTSSPSGLPPSIDQSLAVESHEAETRLTLLALCERRACGCHARPEIRSVWPRSVATHAQSGTLHSLISALHEPVATIDEPGENPTYAIGRSSAKLESWFCTPLSRAPSCRCDASYAAWSAHCASMRALSAATRAAARPRLSSHTHRRVSRSASLPSV
mmetsp:Transcript_37683/g.93668  ORF Transcript_37683/g.93668 Transcript_37683/m.93668 type:complete len:226 (-) Transcript_37683:214-891(-)